MADKKLGIELTAKENVSQATSKVAGALDKVRSGAGQIPAAVGKVGKSLADMGQRGVQAFSNLTQKLFFFREALSTVANLARKLFDMFLAPALAARKVEVALRNMTGSGDAATQMMLDMKRIALDTGVSLQELYRNAPEATAMIKRISGSFSGAQWTSYLDAIKKVAAYRPDLSAAEQIGLVNEMMAGNLEAAAEKLGKSEQSIREAVVATTDFQLGRYTSVVKSQLEQGEKIEVSAASVNEALEKLGIGSATMDKTVTALDRLIARWEIFKETVGAKVLDRLAEGLIKVLDYLEENEDMVTRIAESFGDWMAGGVQKLIEWIDGGGIQVLIDQFKAFIEEIKGAWVALEPIINAVGSFLGSVGGGIGKTNAPGNFGQAVGQTVSRPGTALSRAGETLRMGAGVLTGGLGRLIGGKELGAKWGRFGYEQAPYLLGGVPGVGSLLQGGGFGRQKVQVTVGVDPRNGSIRPYVDQQIGGAFDGVAAGMPMSASWGLNP